MFKKLLVVGVVAALLGACSSTKIANQDALAAAAAQAAAQSEMSLDEAIKHATLAIGIASNEGLDFFAPLHMERARATLEEAKKLRDKDKKGDKEQLALVEALKVQQLLAAARDNRKVVEEVLAKVLDHRNVLLELGADKALPKEFEKGVSLLTGAIKEVEADNLEGAREAQARTLAYFNELEADTLRVQWLTRADAMLAKAKDMKADKYARKSWEAAEQAHQRADDFIETRFRDREGVKRITAQAYVAAAQAHHVSVEVQKVIGKNEKDIEEYVLGIQQLFDSINQYVSEPDLASSSFIDQSRLLGSAIQRGQRARLEAPTVAAVAPTAAVTHEAVVEGPVQGPVEGLLEAEAVDAGVVQADVAEMAATRSPASPEAIAELSPEAVETEGEPAADAATLDQPEGGTRTEPQEEAEAVSEAADETGATVEDGSEEEVSDGAERDVSVSTEQPTMVEYADDAGAAVEVDVEAVEAKAPEA